jgi:hypothetical protein
MEGLDGLMLRRRGPSSRDASHTAPQAPIGKVQAAFAGRGRSDEGLALWLPSLSDPASVAHPPPSIALAPRPTWWRHRWRTSDPRANVARKKKLLNTDQIAVVAVAVVSRTSQLWRLLWVAGVETAERAPAKRQPRKRVGFSNVAGPSPWRAITASSRVSRSSRIAVRIDRSPATVKAYVLGCRIR